ncbi:hypothetical protein JIN77_05250 [Verrucomicrobiaceae bacterium R5-34]|nr:hypothetical protein [Verrucomicrobiaceae bacterium R5-34]
MGPASMTPTRAASGERSGMVVMRMGVKWMLLKVEWNLGKTNGLADFFHRELKLVEAVPMAAIFAVKNASARLLMMNDKKPHRA